MQGAQPWGRAGGAATGWIGGVETGNESFGHRRRRVYRLGGLPVAGRRTQRHRSQCRQADLRGEFDVSAPNRGQSALCFSPGRHLRPKGDFRHFPRIRSRCGAPPRRGIACRPLDRRSGGVHRDQYRGDLCPVGNRARLLATASGKAGQTVPLSPRLDRRSLRFAGTRAANSPKRRPIGRTPLIRHQRRLPITWCVPGARPLDCRPWSATARTITVRTIFRKS